MPDILLCGSDGQFAADQALAIARGAAPPDIRQIAAPVFRHAASEADYCRG